MRYLEKSESGVITVLGLPRETKLDATGNVNHFEHGTAYYCYASHGYQGWVVDLYDDPRDRNRFGGEVPAGVDW